MPEGLSYFLLDEGKNYTYKSEDQFPFLLSNPNLGTGQIKV